MATIERLGVERIGEIIALNHLCFPTDFWKDEDWRELLEDERALYYGAMDSGRIVGNVFIYNWQGEDDYVKIMNVGIHPEYRGQGLARRLMDHAAEEMTALGMRRFCGETRESNQAMRKVFERCGYRLDRLEEGYYDRPAESACKYVLQK